MNKEAKEVADKIFNTILPEADEVELRVMLDYTIEMMQLLTRITKTALLSPTQQMALIVSFVGAIIGGLPTDQLKIHVIDKCRELYDPREKK